MSSGGSGVRWGEGARWEEGGRPRLATGLPSKRVGVFLTLTGRFGAGAAGSAAARFAGILGPID